jgi:hypothetical protein
MRERTLGWVAAVVMLAAPTCLGCGGSAGSLDLIGSPSGADGGAEGGGSGASGGGASGGGASGGGASGGGASGGGGASDGGATGSDGGVNPPGAGPGGSTSQLTCGSTSCAIPAETCCVVSSGSNTSYGCVSGTSCPAPDAGAGGDSIALKCSGAANCSPGTVCCVSKQGAVATSACEVTCTASYQAQLCDLNAPSTGCPTSAACSSKNVGDWGLPSTYATCGGMGN